MTDCASPNIPHWTQRPCQNHRHHSKRLVPCYSSQFWSLTKSQSISPPIFYQTPVIDPAVSPIDAVPWALRFPEPPFAMRRGTSPKVFETTNRYDWVLSLEGRRLNTDGWFLKGRRACMLHTSFVDVVEAFSRRETRPEVRTAEAESERVFVGWCRSPRR